MHGVCVQQGLKPNTGAEWSQFNPTTTWLRKNRCALYGLNDITFARPNLFLMIAETLSYPIFVIQVYAHAQALLPNHEVYNACVFWTTQICCVVQCFHTIIARLAWQTSYHVLPSNVHAFTECMLLLSACAHCLQHPLS